MSRIARGAAVFASVVALGAASAAPANAQDIDPSPYLPALAMCNGPITVPCVIRTGYAVVDATERIVFDTLDDINPLVHRVCYIVTEEPCG